MSIKYASLSRSCLSTGASNFSKRERNDTKPLRSSGLKKASPVSCLGGNGNPSELSVVHGHDLPSVLMARMLGGLFLYFQCLARALAAITKDHRLGGLSNTHFFLSVLEAGKPKIKVPADSVLSEGPLPDWQTAHFLMCLDVWWREEALISLSLLLLFFLAVPYSLWNLNSLTRNLTWATCNEMWSSYHWTTRVIRALSHLGDCTLRISSKTYFPPKGILTEIKTLSVRGVSFHFSWGTY